MSKKPTKHIDYPKDKGLREALADELDKLLYADDAATATTEKAKTWADDAAAAVEEMSRTTEAQGPSIPS